MEVRYAAHCNYRIRYHMVFVVNYRKNLLSNVVSKYLKEVLIRIGQRYYLGFHAIGTDEDHLHILVEAAPRYSPSQVMMICKSITAKEASKKFPELKEELWCGHFWTEDGHIDTVSDGYGEAQMKKYIRKQGRDPNQLKSLNF